MNGATASARMLFPRPGATFLRLLISTLLPALTLPILVAKRPEPALVLFMALFLAAQAAIAMTLGHKELLAASFTFTQPGLRGGLARMMVWQALGVAAAATLLLLLTRPGPAVLAAACGWTLLVYAVFARITLELFWAYQLPAFLYYLFFLIEPLDAAVRAGRLDVAVRAWWLAVPLGVAALVLAARRVRGADLHRSLCGTLVLGTEDIFRPGRQQALKRQRARHGRGGGGMLWRRALLDGLLVRAGRARRAGRAVAARAWLLGHAGLAQATTPRGGKFALILLVILAMMVAGGYADGRPGKIRMAHWFAGLVLSWAGLPLLGVSLAMNSLPRASVSRRAGLRAEARALAWATLATAALGLLLSGVYRVLGAVLPPVPWGGEALVFTAPSLHGVLSVSVLGPALWLAVALRPVHGSTVPSVVMFQVFLVAQFLQVLLPYPVVVPVLLGPLALAGVGAWWRRRRWWRAGDLGV